jgi:fructosamine-3-kinase
MQQAQVARDLSHALGGTWELRALNASGFCATWSARSGDQRLFVKSADGAATEMLVAEADGLQALHATGTVRVPRVACMHRSKDEGLLALEWLDLVPADAGFGARLATVLAALHAHGTSPRFGWRRDSFIGATPQVNTPGPDWIEFVARCRLGAMRERLRGAGAAELRPAVAAVIAMLPRLFEDGHAPVPALVHGDLWQGNWGMLADGTPVIFDPAVSYSDPQAELAMMELFASAPPGFTAAYEGAGGVRSDARRCRLYQLYHLLNHVVLFGGGYVSRALACARSLARS